MNVVDFEACVKDEITYVLGDIGNEVKANRSKVLKYLNVRFFKCFL